MDIGARKGTFHTWHDFVNPREFRRQWAVGSDPAGDNCFIPAIAHCRLLTAHFF
jgi:hypothetical protein